MRHNARWKAFAVGLLLGLATTAAVLCILGLATYHDGARAIWTAVLTVPAIVLIVTALFQREAAGFAAVLLLSAALVAGYRLVLVPDHATPRATSEGVDKALRGIGLPSLTLATTTALCLIAALIAIWLAQRKIKWPLRDPETPWLELSAWVTAGVVVAAVLVPPARLAADRARGQALDREAGRVTTLEYFNPPWLDNEVISPDSPEFRWTRHNLTSVIVEDDTLVGIEGREPNESVVAVQRSNGALLWRYKVSGKDRKSWLSAVVVDPVRQTVLAVSSGSYVVLGFDGEVQHRGALPTSSDAESTPWSPVSPQLDLRAKLASGRVAVLKSEQGRVVGIEAATGRFLWEDDYGACQYAAVNVPNDTKSPTGLDIALLRAGRECGPPVIKRYTGNRMIYHAKINAPKGAEPVNQSMPPDSTFLASPDSATVVAALNWDSSKSYGFVEHVVALGPDGRTRGSITPDLPTISPPIPLAAGGVAINDARGWNRYGPALSPLGHTAPSSEFGAMYSGTRWPYLIEVDTRRKRLIVRDRNSKLEKVGEAQLLAPEWCERPKVSGARNTIVVTCDWQTTVLPLPPIG